MQNMFCGLNRSQMNQVLNVVCELEDRIPDLTEEEQNAYDIGIQCITQIIIRMADNKPIKWD